MDYINQFAEWLNRNTWLNFIFLILSILSIIISVVFYFWSKKEKIPCYYIETFRLARERISKIEGLEITYRGIKVPNMAVSKVVLWNQGNDPIEYSNIAPSDPLKLVIDKDCRLLEADILYTHTKANNFRLEVEADKNEVTILFDYFHKNEGIVIQVYHTGSTNKDIMLQGTIKGVASLHRVNPEEDILLDGLLKNTIGRLPPPKRLENNFLRSAYIFIIVVLGTTVFLPIMMPLMVIDTIAKMFRTKPKHLLKVSGTDYEDKNDVLQTDK